MITLDNVSFKRADAQILDGISFQVETGKKLALLGSNGSGKSILIDIITKNLNPSSGKVNIDKGKGKLKVGVLFDNVHLFPRMKIKETFKYLGTYLDCPQWRDDTLLEALDLLPVMDKQYAYLSAGERKRSQLYLALLGDPDLLILDEPTANLDPNIRSKVWEYIRSREDMTVLLTTHQWEEVKTVVSSVAFIHNGKIIKEPVAPDELVNSFAANDTKIVFPRFDGYEEVLGQERYYEKDNTVNVFPEQKKSFLKELSRWTNEFSISKFDLRDIYNFLSTYNLQ